MEMSPTENGEYEILKGISAGIFRAVIVSLYNTINAYLIEYSI